MFKKLKSLFNDDSKAALTAKETATAKGEPWVNVVDVHFDKDKPSDGYFELDWNQHFVKKLMEAGYSGQTEEEIVDAWFTALCRGISEQETY
jgi:nicotinamidase-related amidase